MAGILLDGEQGVGLVIGIDHDCPAGLDDRQHRVVEGAVVYRSFALLRALHQAVDDGALIPRVGAALGNVAIYGDVGGTVRIGKNLRDDFGPPRPRPALPGSEAFIGDGSFGWYLFAGVDGQAVGRNIFLDGNTDGYSLRVSHRPFVGEFAFQIRIKKGDHISPKALALCERFFVLLQHVAEDWLALTTTKTGAVYRLKGNPPQSHE